MVIQRQTQNQYTTSALQANALKAVFKFARLCIERKIPFAVIFGNHDDEGDLSREDLMRVSEELPYCVARPGFDTVSGVGNYVVAIEQAKSLILHQIFLIE